MKRLFPKKPGKGQGPPQGLAEKIRTLGTPQGNPRRVLVLADLHCGHESGLTPPWFDAKPHTEYVPTINLAEIPTKGPASVQALLKIRSLEPGAAAILRARQLYEARRMCWDWLTAELKELGAVDLAIWNGDLIDGKGPKSGQTELISADRSTQTDMAASAMDAIGEIVGKPPNMLAYGTPYHTGDLEDWEDEVAGKAANVAKIGGTDWIGVAGVIVGYKHHCGRSSIPHGPFTLIAKQKLWEMLWAERGEYPSSDILIRSHVHYHRFCGGPGWVAMTTPALQAYHSKIARRTLGVVDFGFTWLDIWGKGDFQWQVKTLQLRSASDAIVTL